MQKSVNHIDTSSAFDLQSNLDRPLRMRRPHSRGHQLACSLNHTSTGRFGRQLPCRYLGADIVLWQRSISVILILLANSKGYVLSAWIQMISGHTWLTGMRGLLERVCVNIDEGAIQNAIGLEDIVPGPASITSAMEHGGRGSEYWINERQRGSRATRDGSPAFAWSCCGLKLDPKHVKGCYSGRLNVMAVKLHVVKKRDLDRIVNYAPVRSTEPPEVTTISRSHVSM